jgi:hypothetical protein
VAGHVIRHIDDSLATVASRKREGLCGRRQDALGARARHPDFCRDRAADIDLFELVRGFRAARHAEKILSAGSMRPPSRPWTIRLCSLELSILGLRLSHASDRHQRRLPPCKRQMRRDGGRSSRNSRSRPNEFQVQAVVPAGRTIPSPRRKFDPETGWTSALRYVGLGFSTWMSADPVQSLRHHLSLIIASRLSCPMLVLVPERPHVGGDCIELRLREPGTAHRRHRAPVLLRLRDTLLNRVRNGGQAAVAP